MEQPKKASLLGLAAEIRNKIYECALYSRQPLSLSAGTGLTTPSICCTNHQIRHETLKMWATINSFYLATRHKWSDDGASINDLRKYTKRVPSLTNITDLKWSNNIWISLGAGLTECLWIGLLLSGGKCTIVVEKCPFHDGHYEWAREEPELRLRAIGEAEGMLDSVRMAFGMEDLVMDKLLVSCDADDCPGHEITEVQAGEDWSIVECAKG
jgi:hypothetical protein